MVLSTQWSEVILDQAVRNGKSWFRNRGGAGSRCKYGASPSAGRTFKMTASNHLGSGQGPVGRPRKMGPIDTAYNLCPSFYRRAGEVDLGIWVAVEVAGTVFWWPKVYTIGGNGG